MKKIKKALLSVATVVSVAAVTTVTALADGAGSGATEALQSGFSAMVGDITGVITMAIPIAMGLIGLVIAIRFGIKWFRGLVSKT